jgi:heme exporter protein C
MKKLFTPLLIVAAAMFAGAPFLIIDAPYESTMGLIQKIFYFHVGSAMTMFAAAFVSGISSAIFLFGGRRSGDRAAVAAAELAAVFGLIVLVTGPIWARKAWGVWWVWDPRITSTFVLWLIFMSYLLLRRYGGPGSDRLAAGVALFGMANVPFVYWSVNVWRGMHPKTSVIPSLRPGMRGPFWFCVAAFLLMFALVLTARVELEKRRSELEDLYLAVED